MSPPKADPHAAPRDRGKKGSGLRERKKARTRAAIRQQALRLFAEQGYEATTMEQIADAAEVSPSTVFRYFATKEELVVCDEQDAFFLRAWRSQPPELPVVQALRRAVRSTAQELAAREPGARRERDVLMVTVPELWAASLGNVTETMRAITTLVAERTGGTPDDIAVRALSGTLFGVMLDAMLRRAQDPEQDLAAELDRVLAYVGDQHPGQGSRRPAAPAG